MINQRRAQFNIVVFFYADLASNIIIISNIHVCRSCTVYNATHILQTQRNYQAFTMSTYGKAVRGQKRCEINLLISYSKLYLN